MVWPRQITVRHGGSNGQKKHIVGGHNEYQWLTYAHTHEPHHEPVHKAHCKAGQTACRNPQDKVDFPVVVLSEASKERVPDRRLPQKWAPMGTLLSFLKA